MDRTTKLTIKCKIMTYPKMQKEVAEQIADISEKIGGTGISGGKSTAKKIKCWDDALIGVMSREDYLWCKSIEDAINYFKERDRREVSDTISSLYWHSGLNADGIAGRLYVSRATVYNYVDLFIETVHKFALKSGLILEV